LGAGRPNWGIENPESEALISDIFNEFRRGKAALTVDASCRSSKAREAVMILVLARPQPACAVAQWVQGFVQAAELVPDLTAGFFDRAP